MLAQAATLRCTLASGTPEDGDQASWLANWEPGSWRPEYPGPPPIVVIIGREVTRHASARRHPAARTEHVIVLAEAVRSDVCPRPSKSRTRHQTASATFRGYLACHSTTATAMDPRTATV
jgi:hypothetical protein